MTMLAWPSETSLIDAGLACVPVVAAAVLHRRGHVAARGRGGRVRRPWLRGAALRLATFVPAGCGGVALLLAWPVLLRPTLMLATILCLLAAGSQAFRRRPPAGVVAGIDPMLAATGLARIAGLAGDAAQLRIGRIVHLLALRAGLDACSADELQAATMLYGIGRIAVPDPVLRCAAPLDAAELHLLRRGPEIGARILGGSRITLLDCAAELALCHEERWDGSGYPRGLLGVQIPLSARILSLAATFDGLLTGGAGGPPWQPEQVVAHIGAAAGRLFDPQLAGLFLEELPSILALRELPS